MRDLHLAESEPNESTLDLGPEPAQLDQQIKTVRREQRMAGMAVMLLDTARIVEPLMAIFSRLALIWFAVLASTGLAFYALRQPSWERGAIVGGFMILISLLLRLSR